MNNLDRAREWLGRVEVRVDVAAPSQLATLFDLLDVAEPALENGNALPPLGHWLYFSSWGLSSETGEDGEFLDPALPPIELPRRVCVQCSIQFHRSIRVGEALSRVTRVVDLGERDGLEGDIVTLLLRHEISASDGLAISEERRLLYMARGEPWHIGEPRRPRGAANWSRQFRPDTRVLFRYSALTRNVNRVHYDRPFALFGEGHPGLVVQGDLVAASLFELLRENVPGARVKACELRMLRWLYDTEPMFLFGRMNAADEAELWAEDSQGRLALEVAVKLEEQPAYVLREAAGGGQTRSSSTHSSPPLERRIQEPLHGVFPGTNARRVRKHT